MRPSVITGSLLISLAAMILLPALAERGTTPSAVAAPPVVSRPEPLLPPECSPALADAAACARRADWQGALRAMGSGARPDEAAHAALLEAEAALHARDASRAESAARRALDAASGGDIAARAAAVLGSLREAEGDACDAASAFELAFDGLPALAADARRRAAAAWLACGDAPRAQAALAPLPADDARTLALRAQCADALGDAAAHREALARLYYEMPATPEGRWAAQQEPMAGEDDAALAAGRAPQLLSRATALVDAGLASEAAPAAAKLLAASPRDPATLLLSGRVLRATGQGARALPLLAKAAGSVKSPVACRAAHEAARAERRREAADRWRRQGAEGCACEWRDRCAVDLAERAESDRKPETARVLWKRVAETGATPSARAKAAWRHAWSLWTSQRRADALAAFDALAAAHPEQREAAAARYWSARILQADRRDEAAQRLRSLAADFPRDWYGVLAADACGMSIPPLPACAPSDEAEETGRLALACASGDPARAAELMTLDALGFTDDALAEADALAGPATARAGFKALALARAGRSREALREFRRFAPDWRRRTDIPPALAAVAWPRHHERLIEREAAQQGLPPSLVYGVVHQESVFDPAAVSHAGARGLMQVMPATGQTIARWLGERVTTARLLEPETNVRYGTTYLKRLVDETGRVEVALAGYNAGPGRARKWWAATPSHDVAAFVESIPFDETRDYVKAIAVNVRLYAAPAGTASAAE